METDFIIISEYCEKSHTDPVFLQSLEESGLIEIHRINGKQYLSASQLGELEKYSHLYYDLSINIEGIDAIRHILQRIEDLQHELRQLKRRTLRFEAGESFFTED